MKINHVLIMAAGRGMRMRPLTKKVPKAMAKLNGISLISHNLKKISNNIKNTHITVGYKNSLLASHVMSKNVSTILNTSGKGNCWWIYNTLMKNIDECVLVLTCDNLVDLDFESIWKDYVSVNKPICMLVPVKPNKNYSGDFLKCDKDRRISLISRKLKTEYYASGIQLLNPKKINQITKSTDNFYNLWDQLILKKMLYCSKIYPKKWCEINTLVQLRNIEKQMKNNTY